MHPEVVRNLVIGIVSGLVLFVFGFAPIWMTPRNEALAGTRLSESAIPVGESRGPDTMRPINANQPAFGDADELFKKKTR